MTRLLSLERRLALQGVTPEELVRALPALAIEEARRVVAQVHRDEDVATPNAGIRRASRELVVQQGSVPSLEVVADQAKIPLFELDPIGAEGDTYEKLLEKNTDTLEKALR